MNEREETEVSCLVFALHVSFLESDTEQTIPEIRLCYIFFQV